MTARSTIRRTACWTCVAFLIATPSSWAAGNGGGEDRPSSGSEPAGKWTVQFRVKRDFELAGFQDAGLSLQRDMLKASALRIGLGVSFEDDNTRQLLLNSLGDPGEFSLREQPTLRKSYGADVQWIHFSPLTHNARTYAGGGATTAYGRIRTARTTSDVEGVRSASETIEREWRAGVSALAGAEWAPSARFSLMLEYLLEVTYNERETKLHAENYTPYQVSGMDQRALAKTWRLSTTAVRFGIGYRL